MLNWSSQFVFVAVLYLLYHFMESFGGSRNLYF